jgi:hypothetical protein
VATAVAHNLVPSCQIWCLSTNPHSFAAPAPCIQCMTRDMPCPAVHLVESTAVAWFSPRLDQKKNHQHSAIIILCVWLCVPPFGCCHSCLLRDMQHELGPSTGTSEWLLCNRGYHLPALFQSYLLCMIVILVCTSSAQDYCPCSVWLF